MRIKRYIKVMGDLDMEEGEGKSLEEILPTIYLPKKYIKDSEKDEVSFSYDFIVYEDEPFYGELIRQKELWEAAHLPCSFFSMAIAIEPTEEEMEQAVGYLFAMEGEALKTSSCCMNDDAELQILSWCTECGDYGEQIGPYILRKSNKLKRWNTIRKVFYLEYGPEIVCVSIPMYHYLRENHVPEECFQPMYVGIRKKILAGYRLISQNVLPPESFIDLEFDTTRVCSTCKKTKMIGTTEDIYYKNKYLNMDKIKTWTDLNASYEYYGTEPALIVNKRLYSLLIQADPSLKMIPVFPQSRKESR